MKELILWLSTYLFVFLSSVFFKNQINCPHCISIGIIIITIGFAIWILAKIEIEKVKVEIVPDKLITTGIYSKIRHPLYLGVKIMAIGIALLFQSFTGLIFILLLLFPYHFYRIKREDVALAKKFGSKYLDYRKKTLF